MGGLIILEYAVPRYVREERTSQKGSLITRNYRSGYLKWVTPFLLKNQVEIIINNER